VAVADAGYASLKLLDRCRRMTNPITFHSNRLTKLGHKPCDAGVPRVWREFARTRGGINPRG
jgi:hypothetical protein